MLLTFGLQNVKRLRRLDLSSADLVHAMIRVNRFTLSSEVNKI